MENITDTFLSDLQRSKKSSLYALISLVSLCLLAYNSASIFSTRVPISPKTPPEPASFLPENVPLKSRESISSAKLKTHFSLLHKNRNLAVSVYRPKKRKRLSSRFEVRVKELFSFCKFQFFMTWISSMESFGDRELLAIKSLFKTHPTGCCLIIASDSLDSESGMQILKPLLDKGFKVRAISPDFNYLFRNTPAESWYKQLQLGNVNPGGVCLGQNLSNLLRLGLLYRFGGVYLDTDMILVNNLGGLRNAIGAQTLHLHSGNWSRLNNAVMIFDQGHPLLYKFIQEFALTFDGNKWGHNGPYLVSRVVSRLSGRPGYNFTVLPPIAFYPVNWSKIGSLFEGPTSLTHSKWLLAKLKQIRSNSFGVHLWNKQSRGFEIHKGSIIQHIMLTSSNE